MKASSDIVRAFAPSGTLRASLNLGNLILSHRLAAIALLFGVSIDLATGLAQALGVPIELVVFDAAGKSVEAVEQGRADIGFFAIDPKRGEHIAFTPPYVLIEGSYLVPQDSVLQANDEVDRTGTRVVVGKGSAYDLHLSRELKAAEIVRAPTSPTVVDVFVEQKAEVAAGVRQQLESDLVRHPGHRLLPGRFMVIRQAMGVPKSRGAEASAFLTAYVESQKASGFVAQALARHGIQGASVAPAGDGV